MLKVMLVGGDERQLAQLLGCLRGHGETVAHWTATNRCYPPKNPPDVILCYTKHCSHGMSGQARTLATKLKIDIRSDHSMAALLAYIKDKLPKPVLVKPKPVELKRAVWERYNSKADNVSLESARIHGTLVDEYGWQCSPANIARIIKENRKGWMNGSHPIQIPEHKRTTPTIEDALAGAVSSVSDDASKPPSTKELRKLIAFNIKVILDELQKISVGLDQFLSEEDSTFWEGEAARYKAERDTAQARIELIKDTLTKD